MPHGIHTSKRPSGHQQRKSKEARLKSMKTLSGSMLQYIKRPDDGQGTSEDTTCHSAIHKAASMHSAGQQEAEMPESEAQEGVEREESDASESDASNSEDTVKEMNGYVIKEKDLQILSDVSFWEIPVPDHIRVEILKRGSASFQNKDGPFGVSKRQGAEAKGDVRQLSKDWFYKVMPDGKQILRSWMVYSPVSENVYCFCCRLFAYGTTATTLKFVNGFPKWWKLSPKVHNHETSEDHLCCVERWETLAARLRLHKTIDTETITLMEMEKKKWRDILYRLLDVTLFLAMQNLAFRGHKEDESSFNKGNFLEMVAILSKYDPVLKEHCMKLKKSTGRYKVSVSYLAPQTQNEFLSILANHVTEKLVMDIKNAKYFGIMFDSTPDISHTDQMTEVIRYVKISNRKVEVMEVFLGFFALKGKKATDLSSDILKKLENDGLDIMMCRSQGYDNAATMAGIHGGVQAIIKEKNKKAIFSGCVDHSLNLCGQHSFAENASCVKFFGTLQTMFTLFAGSSHRWDVLMTHTGVSVKRLSTTRWSAHYAAVKPVRENFDNFVAAIKALCARDENLDTRAAAEGLLPAVCDFTFLCYLYFWSDVLREVNVAQLYMQTKGLSLDKVVTQLETLRLFLYEERSHLVEHAIHCALLKSEEYGIAIERRARFKKRMPGERSTDAGITSMREENKREMLECIDRFHCELQIRSGAMKKVAGMFESVQAKSLICAAEQELKMSIPKLTTFYDEVSESELLLEIPRLRRHLKAANINLDRAKEWAALDVLAFIAEWDVIESLPNLSLSLKLFLTICVSVASCERSFSKLKIIKNHLRSTMGQSRLSDLAMLSVESELARKIDFEEVINNFATLKARKGKF
uniref:TTF-type domain-containing protein n=1 Tax=Leptobrachium leishanense TaxID=445787 RepID=A0A8C5PE46_9ANUR